MEYNEIASKKNRKRTRRSLTPALSFTGEQIVGRTSEQIIRMTLARGLARGVRVKDFAPFVLFRGSFFVGYPGTA